LGSGSGTGTSAASDVVLLVFTFGQVVLLALGDAAPLAVASVDLGPEAGAEPTLRLQLDAILLGEGDGERRP
jgi:hypothetical protein